MVNNDASFNVQLLVGNLVHELIMFNYLLCNSAIYEVSLSFMSHFFPNKNHLNLDIRFLFHHGKSWSTCPYFIVSNAATCFIPLNNAPIFWV